MQKIIVHVYTIKSACFLIKEITRRSVRKLGLPLPFRISFFFFFKSTSLKFVILLINSFNVAAALHAPGN